MSTNQRIRGRALQRIRRLHFQARPLCVECEKVDRVSLATQLDHIIPVDKGGPDTHDPFENRQGLCDECHETKTKVDMGYSTAEPLDPSGWPPDG